MDELELVKNWLMGYPGLETLQVDALGARPGDCGLFPLGLRVVETRRDVLGNIRNRCRLQFLLRRVAYRQEDGAAWCLAFQNWVRQQSAAGLAPRFGSGQEEFRAEKGKLSKVQAGAALYEVQLTAEFMKEE